MKDHIAYECELPDDTRIRLCNSHIGRYPNARILDHSLGQWPNQWPNTWPNQWPTMCKVCSDIEYQNRRELHIKYIVMD